MKAALVLLMLWMPVALAATEGAALQHVNIDLSDHGALQRGAKYFVNYCIGCHGARYMRYSQLAPALGISDAQIKKYLIFAEGKRVGDPMTTAMPAADAKQAFGTPPPDLTNEVNARGADWIYTYLQSFYLDHSRPFGVNNLLFPDVAMPDVLWQLQGWQVPVYETTTGPDGKPQKHITGLRLQQQGSMTPAQYDRMLRDLVTFLAYLSRPYQPLSRELGAWVVVASGLFTLLAFLLRREYWKDVH